MTKSVPSPRLSVNECAVGDFLRSDAPGGGAVS